MKPERVRTSKFLSLVLRHAPERIGLTLEHGGWARVDELLRLAAAAGHTITPDTLRSVVAENDKQRFALTPDGAFIRANQGHSIDVDLGLEPREPPETLYHGTAQQSLASIRRGGLLPGRRQHVHLSLDAQTAQRVGSRHGAPVVLEVAAGALHGEGGAFFCAENGVWLTAHVAPRFLRIGGEGGSALPGDLGDAGTG